MGKPWQFQKWRLNNNPIPEIPQIVEEAKSITKPRSAALFCILYLTAGRVSEVIEIRRRNLSVESINDRPIFKIQLPNRKHRNRKWKVIPIPLDNEYYLEMFRIIKDYAKLIDREDLLFPITKRRAQKIIENEFNMNAHLFRHIRLTHLAHMGFSDQELILYSGWTDSRAAKNYIHLRWRDLINKL